MKDQSYCPKCYRMYCEGFWNEGVCIKDMYFCGEPTADGDAAAEYLRVWYEKHRETWWERRKLVNKNGHWISDRADNLMLGLINEVTRINSEKKRQLNKTKFTSNL